MEQARQTFKAILSIPTQILPIDTEHFSPGTIVHAEGMDVLGKLYKFCFITAFVSIFVGVINLLPIGYLDGGRIFVLLIEQLTNKKISRKQIISMSFVIVMTLYLIIVFLNYSKFSIYMNHLYGETLEFLR